MGDRTCVRILSASSNNKEAIRKICFDMEGLGGVAFLILVYSAA